MINEINRRVFLKDTAAGVGGLVLSGDALQARVGAYPRLQKKPFGFGIYAHIRAAFKGQYRYDKKTIESWAKNPYIAGTQLNYLWGELEPAEGEYKWGMIERDLDLWAAHGKKCWLEIPTAGRWAREGMYPTPQWVYDKGVPKIEAEGTGTYPVFWNEVYLELWSNFLRALAKKYDGDPRLDHISTAGYSNGTEPRLSSKEDDILMDQWLAAGFDGFGPDGVYYTQAIRPIMGYFAEAFEKTPISQTYIDKNEFKNVMYAYAGELGFILTSNGMGTNSMNPESRQKWRDRKDQYRVTVGYHEWGPSGRNIGGNEANGKVPLLWAYQNMIGDDSVPELAPHSSLSYVPLSQRIEEVETESEWMAALEWASENLEKPRQI